MSGFCIFLLRDLDFINIGYYFRKLRKGVCIAEGKVGMAPLRGYGNLISMGADTTVGDFV